jgi:CheY-like chemotaxis protein
MDHKPVVIYVKHCREGHRGPEEVEERMPIRQGGTVSAACRPNEPDGAKEQRSGERLRAPVRRGEAGTKRILFVEDRALFREGLALLLQWRTGLECVHAGSLAEAQRILDDIKGTLFIAIVDLELPDGAAIELLEGLRGLPVLALTSGRNLQQRRARALEAGVDEVLSTESPVEEIVGTVQRLIAGSRNPARVREGSLRALGGTTR